MNWGVKLCNNEFIIEIKVKNDDTNTARTFQKRRHRTITH